MPRKTTTLSEGSLLRVSEIPAKRFDLGWLRLTNERHPGGGVFSLVTLSGKTMNPMGSRVQLAIWRSQGNLLPTPCRGFPFKGIGDSRTGHLSWTVWVVSFSKIVFKAFPFAVGTLFFGSIINVEV